MHRPRYPNGPTANAPFCSIAITPWCRATPSRFPPRFPLGSTPPSPKALSCAWCPTTGIAVGHELCTQAGTRGYQPRHEARPFALKAGLKRLGATADEAVLIRRRLYTRRVGGNFAGVDTILVKPQATQDLWYTQIFRIFERRACATFPTRNRFRHVSAHQTRLRPYFLYRLFGRGQDRRSRVTSALCSSGVLSIPTAWSCAVAASR